PGRVPIVRSINARFSVSLRGAVAGHLGLDRGIDDVRTRSAHIESDSSDVDLRQSLCESRPRIAGIDALPDSAAGTATDVGVWPSLTLERRGVNHVGVRGIEDYVGEPGVRVDVLDVLPGASAIRG